MSGNRKPLPARAPNEDAWRDEALCTPTALSAHVGREVTIQEIDSVFFPPRGQSSRPARRICAECPVMPECLDYAARANEVFGIWGGAPTRERRAIRKKLGLRGDRTGAPRTADSVREAS